MKNIPYRFYLVLLVFILATTLACSTSNSIQSIIGTTETPSPTTDETASPGEPAEQTAKPGTKNTAVKAQTIEEQTTTPETANSQMVDINPNIASLDNYRISLNITAQGKNDQGMDIKETFSSLEEVNKTASATHVNNSDEAVTDTTETTNIDIYAIGDQVYMVDNTSGEPTCTVYGSSEETIEGLGGIGPGQMFDNVEKDSLIKNGETVNSINTDHYSAKNIRMSLGDTKTISGEIWIAQDGQYIARFSGKAEGSFLLNSNIITGSVTWDYNVTDVNKVGTMEAPNACANDQPQAIDANGFPIPQNATDKQILGDFIAFESPDDANVVLEYYRKELPAKGWAITQDTEVDGAYLIGITKDNSNLEITVIPGDPSGCSVVVNTTE